MMQFKQLQSDLEFQLYQDGFSKEYSRLTALPSTPIPLDYLQRSSVVGLFNSSGKMVAGYIINGEAPFRLFDFVPPHSRENLTPPFQLSWSNVAEVTCVWKSREVSSIFMSLCFWPRVHWAVFTSGEKALLGHDQNKRLDQFYTWAHPKTLYSGVSSSGLPSHLFAYYKPQLLFCIAMLILVETPRRTLKRVIKR